MLQACDLVCTFIQLIAYSENHVRIWGYKAPQSSGVKANGNIGLRFQPVDATHSLNFSARTSRQNSGHMVQQAICDPDVPESSFHNSRFLFWCRVEPL
ncbi:MAG: hypothetical protein OEQ14_16980, partial [Gammaproteobacteria bacterium]|nr:hypothetical protein [Gammaproteobacteria bacterium]